MGTFCEFVLWEVTVLDGIRFRWRQWRWSVGGVGGLNGGVWVVTVGWVNFILMIIFDDGDVYIQVVFELGMVIVTIDGLKRGIVIVDRLRRGVVIVDRLRRGVIIVDRLRRGVFIE